MGNGCSWRGIGLGEYWYGWFDAGQIWIHTHEPERFANEYDGKVQQYGGRARYAWQLRR